MNDVSRLAPQRPKNRVVEAERRTGADIAFENIELRDYIEIAEQGLHTLAWLSIGAPNEDVDGQFLARREVAQQFAAHGAGRTRQEDRLVSHLSAGQSCRPSSTRSQR